MPKKQATQKAINPVAADSGHVLIDYDICLLKQGNHTNLMTDRIGWRFRCAAHATDTGNRQE